MTLDDSLLILAIKFFTKMMGSYQNDSSQKKKNIYIYIYIYILHIELEHGGKLLQKYEFRKMPSKQNERGKNSQCLIIFFFFAFLRIFALGLFC